MRLLDVGEAMRGRPSWMFHMSETRFRIDNKMTYQVHVLILLAYDVYLQNIVDLKKLKALRIVGFGLSKFNFE